MTQKHVEAYHDLKKRHPEAVLIWQMNNYYAAYDVDADTLRDKLGLNVSEDETKWRRVMFPLYALDTYLPKMIRAGLRVAICDSPEF